LSATLRTLFLAVNSKVPSKLFRRAPKKMELTTLKAKKTRPTLPATNLKPLVSYVWL